MKKEVYLHIGFQKTASTYLQDNVFPHFEGVKFVNKNKYVNKWLGCLRSFDTSYFHNKNNIYKKLESEYSESQKFLISKEVLVGNPFANFSDNTSIAHTLKKSFPDAKILLIIRKQDDLLNYLYSLYLKFGGRKKIKDFLYYGENSFTHSGLYTLENRDQALPPIGVSPHSLNYYNIISNYIELFGKENIKIIPYELLKYKPKEFITEIEKFLEITEQNIKINSTTVNQNNMGGEVKFMRFLNKFARIDNNPIGFIPIDKTKHSDFGFLTRLWTNIAPKNLKTIKSISKTLATRKSNTFMDQNLREEIMEIHFDSNKKLDDLLNLDLKKLKYY
tara:strand:- start:7235 stop:8233 length:999 start_codon:yes stop_codon:yes gene_type:complete